MNASERPGQALCVLPNNVPNPSLDITVENDCGEAVFAGGCFWCTEAIFKRLHGVREVQPGYAGGVAGLANYTAVCTGTTNHAEVIRIAYDAKEISYGQLLKVFFSIAHDPTQIDRQGEDTGTQYRSAVFYLDTWQYKVADAYIKELDASGIFSAPIATTLESLEAFFMAEAYHHDYASINPNQSYIRLVAQPKVLKLEKYFSDRLKKN